MFAPGDCFPIMPLRLRVMADMDSTAPYNWIRKLRYYTLRRSPSTFVKAQAGYTSIGVNLAA